MSTYMNATEVPASDLSILQQINLKLQSCFSYFSIFDNFVILLTLLYIKHFHNKRYIFLMSLSLSDFLTGFLLAWTTHKPSQLLIQCANTTSIIATLSILGATLDRTLAITHPLHYERVSSATMNIIASVIIWIFSGILVLASPVIISFAVVGFIVSPILIFFIVIIITLLNISILKSLSHSSSFMSDERREENQRVVNLLLILTATFVFCWLPLCITFPQAVFSSETEIQAVDCLTIAQGIPMVLLTLQAGLNPLIYWWRLPSFHQGMKKLFQDFWRNVQMRSVRVDYTARSPTISNTNSIQDVP
ncbi:5-hydroxytryptamine receptor 2A-like [Anneissia japonica]|uniref:5-hydroxytryptamine receptor 2A-like n=1 Tax=Anneissia japonica TaxID=1529436 RepID=UPI0014258530|nr:5-hydroxytryptamine receptor 2A-like [Anneissia japonica]